MRAAITGSEGFIGSNLCDALRNRECLFRGLDRKDMYPCSLDVDACEGMFVGSDTVFHLAAHADVMRNWDDGELAKIERDNVTATLRILEACRQAGGVKTFVFVSTAAVYDGQSGTVYEGIVGPAPSPYAASKLAGEAYVQAYAKRCGWDAIIVRPAACLGKYYSHGHVLDFVRQHRAYGKLTPIDNGSMMECVHVDDVVRAMIFLAEKCIPGTFNVSAGDWHWMNTVHEMEIAIGRELDRSIETIGGKRSHHTMDMGMLNSYGFYCEKTIGQGVRDTLESLGWPDERK